MKARSICPAGMSGRIVAIGALDSSPEIIYAGAASGGVWKPIFDDQKLINTGTL